MVLAKVLALQVGRVAYFFGYSRIAEGANKDKMKTTNAPVYSFDQFSSSLGE